MNRFAMPAVFLCTALLLSSAAQAMEAQVYERMSANDQGRYTGVMILGAEQVLTAAGMADQAAQVEKLFTTKQAGDQNTVGMVEFELNLAAVDKADADNLVKNPDARHLQVEIAVVATLKANGIVLPRDFMHVGDNFRPNDPLLGPARTPPTTGNSR